MAKAEFDNAVNVMPRNDNPDANDEIVIDDHNGNNNNNNGGDEMDQPPGLPIEMEGGNNGNKQRGGGNFSPRNIQENYLVDDGPQIFSAGPIASIYGSDIQQDMLSIGRGTAAQRQQQQRSPSNAGSKYRIMPDVNVMPLQPLNTAQLNAVAGSSRQSQLRVEPSQSQASSYHQNQHQQQLQDDNDDHIAGGATMTICADCGVNIDAEECPQICDITGKAHY